jgi:hypothetical protein
MSSAEMLNSSATVSSVTNLASGCSTGDLWIIFDSPIADDFLGVSDIIVSTYMVSAFVVSAYCGNCLF